MYINAQLVIHYLSYRLHLFYLNIFEISLIMEFIRCSIIYSIVQVLENVNVGAIIRHLEWWH